MELPLPFRERMKQMLGDEYGEFLESYDRERSQGLRLNLLKTGRRNFWLRHLLCWNQFPGRNRDFIISPRTGRAVIHTMRRAYIISRSRARWQ